MQHMDDLLHQALAAEIRAELARRNLTAKAAQQAIGLSSTAWQGYFKTLRRDPPTSVLAKIADFVDMPLWQLIRNAEERAAQMGPHDIEAERALRSLSPETEERARRIAREIRDAPEEPAPAKRTARG
jgi:transcriptional regulator with XRE-family HTH domain